MHDELERALTGRPERRGLSPFGWVLATLGIFVLVGTVGAGVVAYKVANGVREGIEDMARELGATPGVAMVRMGARLASADELITMEPQRGLALLADLQGADAPMDVLRAMGALRSVGVSEGASIAGISADPGAVDAGEQDRVSAQINSGDEHVAIDLRRTREGGLFAIDTEEGSVRVELIEGEEGGRLRILADDRTAEVAMGSDASDAPAWAEGLVRIPSRARPVVSLRSDRGLLGAVAWDAEEDAMGFLDTVRGVLEANGYEVQAEHRLHDDAEEQGSLWARHEGEERMLFVVTHRARDGRTGVLAGFGERRD